MIGLNFESLSIVILVQFLIYCTTNCDDGLLWYNWSSWSDGCKRNCSEYFGYQFRMQTACLKCRNNVCIEDETIPNACTKSNQTALVERKMCYIADHCSGKGKFTGYYDEDDWTRVGQCVRLATDRNCMKPGNQLMVRKCKKSRKTIQLETETIEQVEHECTPFESREKYVSCNVTNCDEPIIDGDKQQSHDSLHMHWSIWKCKEKCMKQNLLSAFRTKECKSNSSGYCNATMAMQYTQTGSCQYCFKQWTQWDKAWSGCDVPCGSKGRFRQRNCTGFGKPCICENYWNSEKCDIEFDLCEDESKMLSCGNVDGGWSSWSIGSACSVTCGNRPGRREYTRLCNNPKPSGAGVTCIGDGSKTELCQPQAACKLPIAWTEWSNWVCSATCDYDAVEIRSRKCNKPVDEKDNCTGKSMETRECKIVSDQCPPIHLTLQLENMIRDHLDSSHNSIMADEGDHVKYQCNANIIYNLTKFSERESNKKNKFEYFWYHNESPVDDKIISVNSIDLLIENVTLSDSGVYLCYAILQDGKTPGVIIDAYALAVKSKQPDHESRAGTTLKIPSQSISLNHVLENMIEEWYFNGIRVQNRKHISVVNMSLTIDSLALNDTGIYECRIIDPIKNRTWVTNRVHVNVIPIVTVFQAFIIILTLVVGIGSLSIIQLFRKLRQKNRQNKKQRHSLAIQNIKY